MQHVLIAGVDTVIGGNLATQLADEYHVTGVSSTKGLSIEGCETLLSSAESPQAIGEILRSVRPDRVVLCNAAGDSPWYRLGQHFANPNEWNAAATWAELSTSCGAAVTLFSSDAVFTGPWMFHTETSTSFCTSSEARNLRECERRVIGGCPNSLVIRTHAYGWSPVVDRLGWIEGILASLEGENSAVLDYVPHATPILATDLADVIGRAWVRGLTGVYHVAGAERANPYRFVCLLARIFELAPPRAKPLGQSALGSGFAEGESSLHTRKIRRELQIAMPLLAEGFERLREQGGRDRRFNPNRPGRLSKVA